MGIKTVPLSNIEEKTDNIYVSSFTTIVWNDRFRSNKR